MYDCAKTKNCSTFNISKTVISIPISLQTTMCPFSNMQSYEIFDLTQSYFIHIAYIYYLYIFIYIYIYIYNIIIYTWTKNCAVSLANHLRAVADAFCPLRTHQHYLITEHMRGERFWTHFFFQPHSFCGEASMHLYGKELSF